MLKQITSEYHQSIYNLPWLVAQAEGIFAREGLEVSFVRATTHNPTIQPVWDPKAVDPNWNHVPFENGASQTYSACEWGQIRRSSESQVGGRIAMLRPTIVSQALFVRPDSSITDPHDLRNKSIAVNFHAGSHYLALQVLDGFMDRDQIKVVHYGSAQDRFQALLDGRVDATIVMEPYIAIAEKAGCQLIFEAFLNGSEISSPEIDQETFDAINRALTDAVRRINAAKRDYVHYLIEDVPAELGPVTADDFRLDRIRCVPPRPYPPEDFERTRAWMLSWGLLSETACFEDLVDNRVGVAG